MDDRTPLLDVAAALATRHDDHLRATLERATDRCPPELIEEVVLMAVFVTGFPLGIGSMQIWRDVIGDRGNRWDRSVSDVDLETLRARGREACGAVYGAQFERLVDNLATLHPALAELVISAGYGQMMARPGLDLVWRELALIAMLVVWHAPTQLYSHLRGARLVGASGQQIEGAIEAGLNAIRATGGDVASAQRAAESAWSRLADGSDADLTGSGEVLKEA